MSRNDFVILPIPFLARRADLSLCRTGLPACPLRSLCSYSLIPVQPPRLARDTTPMPAAYIMPKIPPHRLRHAAM